MDYMLLQDAAKEDYDERLRDAERVNRLLHIQRVIKLPVLLRGLLLLFG
jgi:hypothetical protein